MARTVSAKSSMISIWFRNSDDLSFVYPYGYLNKFNNNCIGIRRNDVGIPWFDY